MEGDFIIKYEIFTQAGAIHAKQGKENEDSVRVIENGDSFFCIMSDGAGSSELAKQASQLTVNEAACFFEHNSSKFFHELDGKEQAEKTLVFNVQQALFEEAKKYNTDLLEMMCTLLIIGIDKENKRYVTFHVGDGLIAKMKNDKVDIISYPENGATKQYTYFVNSPDVFNHLRISSGKFDDEESFFIATDGYFEGCNNSKDYKKRIREIDCPVLHQDDVTCCIIKQCVL